MESLMVDLCHFLRIADPFSVQVAVGVVGGGIPLLATYVFVRTVGSAIAKVW